jgi:signal transduction histidine kinase
MGPRRNQGMADPRRTPRKGRETSDRFAGDDLRLENQQLLAANRRKDDLLAGERKAREEAERSGRGKSEFLALLSHKFRTPLQAIFGYTEMLEREIHGPLTDAQRRDLLRIRQSEHHLLDLLTAILEFERVESEEPVQRAGND